MTSNHRVHLSHRSRQSGSIFATVIINLLSLVPLVLFTGLAAEAYQLFQNLNKSELFAASQLPEVGALVRLEGQAAALKKSPDGADEHGPSLLKSPFGETPCLWYEFDVEEYHNDLDTSSSSTQSRDRWDTIASGSERVNFRLVDARGEAIIYSQDADVVIDPSFEREVIRKDPLYYHPQVPRRELSRSLGRRKFTESVLKPKTNLTILGVVGTDRQGRKVVMRDAKTKGSFSISDKSYQDTLSHYKSQVWSNSLHGGGLIIFLSVLLMIAKIPRYQLNLVVINVGYWLILAGRLLTVSS